MIRSQLGRITCSQQAIDSIASAHELLRISPGSWSFHQSGFQSKPGMAAEHYLRAANRWVKVCRNVVVSLRKNTASRTERTVEEGGHLFLLAQFKPRHSVHTPGHRRPSCHHESAHTRRQSTWTRHK